MLKHRGFISRRLCSECVYGLLFINRLQRYVKKYSLQRKSWKILSFLSKNAKNGHNISVLLLFVLHFWPNFSVNKILAGDSIIALMFWKRPFANFWFCFEANPVSQAIIVPFRITRYLIVPYRNPHYLIVPFRNARLSNRSVSQYTLYIIIRAPALLHGSPLS